MLFFYEVNEDRPGEAHFHDENEPRRSSLCSVHSDSHSAGLSFRIISILAAFFLTLYISGSVTDAMPPEKV